MTCDSCGANVVINGKSGQCHFCGNIVLRPKPKTDSSEGNNIDELETFLLEPTITESQFDALFKQNVIDKDPEKITDENNTDLISLAFIRYSGSYTGSFTCLSGRERVNYIRRSNGESSWNERVVDIEYEPFQAQLHGEYIVDVCVDKEMFDNLLDTPNDTIQFMQRSTKYQALKKIELDDIASQFDIDAGRIRESIELGIERINDRTLFPNRVYPLIDETVTEAAYNQAPTPSKDISATFDYSIENAIAFTAFFYLRTYQQKENTGLFVADAGDGTVWGEADEPGIFELTGRALSSLFGSVKKFFSQSAEGVAAVPGLMAVLASKAATSKSIINTAFAEKKTIFPIDDNQSRNENHGHKKTTLRELEEQYENGSINKKQFFEARFKLLTNNAELQNISATGPNLQSSFALKSPTVSIVELKKYRSDEEDNTLRILNNIDDRRKQGSISQDDAIKEKSMLFGSISSGKKDSESKPSQLNKKKECAKCRHQTISSMVICPNCGSKNFIGT